MNVNVNLTIEEANLVLAALGKLPYEQSAALIFKIKSDAERQIQESKMEKE
jgi:hypothetical protein